jgi:hypothetical protein
MVFPTQFFAAEPQFLCGICSEAITNPICPNCLAAQIEAWSTLYPDLEEKILPKIKETLKRVEDTPLLGIRCIKCGEETTNICPYCFTESIFRELVRMRVNKIILAEFLTFFNFDLDHRGYFKEAENKGLV